MLLLLLHDVGVIFDNLCSDSRNLAAKTNLSFPSRMNRVLICPSSGFPEVVVVDGDAAAPLTSNEARVKVHGQKGNFQIEKHLSHRAGDFTLWTMGINDPTHKTL